MSSRIEQLIDEIEDYIADCKPATFSAGKIVVNKEEIESMLEDLRRKTPGEIKRYQDIISRKEEILDDARNKAAALIDEATIQTNELVNEQEIMLRAHDQSEELVELASRQAQEIIDNATIEANQIRAASIQYTDDLLGKVEEILNHSLETSRAKYESLMTSLQDCLNIVSANRAELYPVEPLSDEMLEDGGESGGEGGDDLDVI